MLAVARFGGQVHLKKGVKVEPNSCKEVYGMGCYSCAWVLEHEGTFIDILGYEGYILILGWVYNF